MKKQIYFLSAQARWQKYRMDVLSELSREFNYEIEVLTTGKLESYINSKNIAYKVFNSWLPLRSKFNFFPSSLLYIIKRRPDYVLAQPNALELSCGHMDMIMEKLKTISYIG